MKNPVNKDISYQNYKTYRNVLNKIIKQAKTLYWEKQFNASKNNLNQILNRNKMNKEPPESFIEDNRNIVGNENIAKQ